MKERRGILRNKKGASLKGNLIKAGIVVGVIFVILILIPFLWGTWNYYFGGGKDVRTAANATGIKGFFYKVLYTTGKILGFDKGYQEIKDRGYWGYILSNIQTAGKFVWHLFIGLLAGLWIFLVAFGAKALVQVGISRWKNRWIVLMGDDVWKIFAIGLGYAVVLEIPIINRFVQIITFEFLGVNWFIRSLIIAFWVGLGPAWIEDFMKYRLRMKAEKAIIAAQMRAKLEKATFK